MSQFDHESVKGTELGDEEVDDETLQDIDDGEGAVKVGDTVDEVTAPDADEESSSASTE